MFLKGISEFANLDFICSYVVPISAIRSPFTFMVSWYAVATLASSYGVFLVGFPSFLIFAFFQCLHLSCCVCH